MIGSVVPSLNFSSSDDIDWTSSPSELTRFRENTRPKELLDLPYYVAPTESAKIVFITSPELVEKILVSDDAKYPKAAIQQRLGRQIFGPSINATLGEQNKRQKECLKYFFTGKQAEKVKTVARVATIDAIKRWQQQGEIDLYREFGELALQITWATLFGNNQYISRETIVVETIDRLHSLNKSDYKGSAQVLSSLIDHFIVEERWRILERDNPFRGVVEKGQTDIMHFLNARETRANALLMAASAHITTGVTLSWCFRLLAQYPQYQNEIYQSILANESGACTKELVRSCLNETMRLFPPVPEVLRDAKVGLELPDLKMPKGSLVMLPFYFMHRHNTLWENPNEFHPERFRRNALKSGPRKQGFYPFSAGNYGCSGMTVAWSEMYTILVTCIKYLQFDICEVSQPEMSIDLGTLLYPKSPLKCDVRARSRN
ncbi:cytochrome P450 [Alteromonas sp. ZYF713]|nr:cytochrome P450 [Alteromonas sp. ZYF713]